MTDDPSIVDKMHHIHRSLTAATMPHAFGGALALAFCVRQARGTHDIDLNIFTDASDWARALDGLPDGVEATDRDRHLLSRDAQARLWWGRHPIDVFLVNTEFHAEAASRVRWNVVAEVDLPFLDCGDLAVFKAFFDRSKDWVDIEEMLRAQTLDVAWVLGTLVEHLGGADRRVERLRSLAAEVRAQR